MVAAIEQGTTVVDATGKTTQQNSAPVEETIAAASTLRQEANTLQNKIANFRVA